MTQLKYIIFQIESLMQDIEDVNEQIEKIWDFYGRKILQPKTLLSQPTKWSAGCWNKD